MKKGVIEVLFKHVLCHILESEIFLETVKLCENIL